MCRVMDVVVPNTENIDADGTRTVIINDNTGKQNLLSARIVWVEMWPANWLCESVDGVGYVRFALLTVRCVMQNLILLLRKEGIAL